MVFGAGLRFCFLRGRSVFIHTDHAMPRGGKRKGAGRPRNSGKFGEPTKAVRLPVSKIGWIMEQLEKEAERSKHRQEEENKENKKR